MNEELTLWGGHVDYNKSGQSAFRGRHESMAHLKFVFENSIKGWMPHAHNDLAQSWGEVRSDDGRTILSQAVWDGTRWLWFDSEKITALAD